MDPFEDELDVAVEGGSLRVSRGGAEPGAPAPVVLAAHGITSSSRAWSRVARLLGREVCFLAADLRGRGEPGDGAALGRCPPRRGPRGDPGPRGRRARDSRGPLAGRLRGRRAGTDLAGARGGRSCSSTGDCRPKRRRARTRTRRSNASWAPPWAACARPSRASRTTWRSGAGTRGSPAATFATTTFTPARSAIWWATPLLRPAPRQDAVREDGRAILHAEEVRGAALRAGVPSTLIRARRGLMDDPEHPFVPVGEARAFQGRPDARLVELEGAGHDAITLGALGAGAVAGAIRDAPL